jgi:hypothetical protein
MARKTSGSGASPSVPTPRKPQRSRTVPRAAATNLPDTMKPPFMGMAKTRTKKTRRKA